MSPLKHTLAQTRALKFLLFRTDLWITLFSGSDGMTSKGPLPFELAGFYREAEFDREKETKRKSLPTLMLLS